MPKCPNETSRNSYKTTHLMRSAKKVANGLIYECTVCHATVLTKRVMDFLNVDHPRKEVTVEPILWFDGDLVNYLQFIKPEFIYVGYDTKNCQLPEPTLAQTETLIKRLKDLGFDVRLKTMRKAWYEAI